MNQLLRNSSPTRILAKSLVPKSFFRQVQNTIHWKCLSNTIKVCDDDPLCSHKVNPSPLSFCSVVSNYLAWSLVQSLVSRLSKPFRDASKILRKALVGSEGGESPWRYCVSDTNEVIGFALGAMFVREVFKGDSKPMVKHNL